ncbi:ferredoxin [Nonomuraea sp. H19]|uniref:ferredoxin n=1 Tax=Nonomuraea sp. H19 TaxID=3452206 RepID=UPI003F89B048
MKVIVEQGKCCSAGTCVLIAPEVFDQRDDDGIVILLDERPPEELHPIVHEAVSVCPGAAISTSEDT